MILKQFEVGPLVVFSYLIGCEKTREAALIDPAAETDRLLDEATSSGLSIKYVINTHAHPDHISGNAAIVGKTGAKIIIHESEAKYLTALTNRALIKMFGGSSSPEANIAVVDGDVIDIGSVRLTVLHTPGHTPGGICLYDGAKNVFTGDTLFVGGVGRTDLPGGSTRVLLDSIKTKILSLPDDTIIWPGHNYGPMPHSTVKNERMHNPFFDF